MISNNKQEMRIIEMKEIEKFIRMLAGKIVKETRL